MIQISTPAQASDSPSKSGFTQNGSSVEGSSGAWGRKVQKKDKPGIFAKLIENLTGKPKNSELETNGLKTDALKANGLKINREAIHALRPFNPVEGKEGSGPEKTGKNNPRADTNAKKTRNSGTEHSITFSYRAIPAAVSGLREQIQVPAESGPHGVLRGGAHESRFASNEVKAGKAGSVIRSDSLLSGDAGRKPGAGKTDDRKGETAALNAGKGGENRLAGIPLNSSGKEAAEKPKNTGKIQGADKLKGAKTAEPGAASAKDTGTGFVQEQAALRLFPGSVKPEGGEAENGKVSEGRGRKGREKLNIEVRDVRSTDAKEAERIEASKAATVNSPGPVHTEIELPVDLGLSLGKGNEGAAGKDASQSRGFEDALAGELRGDLSTDIVRDASIIVRNGGEGTIRLSLHPASLGDVKIRLEMTENKITGHIVVGSNEALRAFERELPVLEKAFRDSGFSETNLDMSLAQDAGNYGSRNQRREGDFEALTPIQAASRYDAGLDGINGTTGSDEPGSPGRTEASAFPGGVISSGLPGRKTINLFV